VKHFLLVVNHVLVFEHLFSVFGLFQDRLPAWPDWHYFFEFRLVFLSALHLLKVIDTWLDYDRSAV